VIVLAHPGVVAGRTLSGESDSSEINGGVRADGHESINAHDISRNGGTNAKLTTNCRRIKGIMICKQAA